MEIRLGTYEISETGEQTISFGEFIDEIKLERLKFNISILEEFRSNSELHSIFIINFLELSQYFEEAVEDLISKQITSLWNNTQEFRIIYRNSNRLLLNFLSSGRMLIDHLETYLKRKYGKESHEAIRLKMKASEVYDANFEYRFVYKLRNYSQHCGFPITQFKLNTKNNREEDRLEVEVLFNPLFSRDELLNKYKEWGPVKYDLESQEEGISVMWTITRYYECMEMIVKEFEGIALNEIFATYSEMMDFLSQYGELREGMEPCVFYDFRFPDPTSFEHSIFTSQHIPMDILGELRDKLKHSKLI